ncbi:MAG: peptide-N-glycosidase F-related protein [Bacteroidetes bacterium]|nr:peptide-N-glycosidase F-related protein [Bacteroidota bacterium]
MKNIYLKFSLLFLIFSFISINNANSQSNQYLNFDGLDDYVNVPNASTLVSGTSSMSITGWFFLSQLGYGHGMMGFRGSGATFYLIELGTGQIECRYVNASNTLFQVTAPANTLIPNLWQHYAWVYDGSAVKLYLNGNLVGSTAASGSFPAINTAAFVIGLSPATGYNFYYKGGIDEVTLWKKALTQAEIQYMQTHEPVGNEQDLQLYYKFNQGVPGANNGNITKLTNEVAANTPTYDGDITNFAMNGNTSNFIGTLNSSFQAISFPPIGPKLTTSPPFKLTATATSGLAVGYTLISGPATIHNDTVTLTGAGTVKIQAYQNGNAQYDTAVPILNTFDVVNPTTNVPIIDPRHPLAGNVYMPALAKIQLAAIATINYTPVFSVQELHFKINGTTIAAHDFGNGHYTAWWQPPAYGSYTVEIYSTNNFGAVASKTVNINVTSTVADTTVQAFSGIINNSSVINEVTVDGELPSFLGAYDTIYATLTVSCPPGGCGAWDYVRSIRARSHEGNWFEIIRYITPYGTACSHKLNLADYASILNGKVTFKIMGLDNGYYYALSFTYKKGLGPHPPIYSQVTEMWDAHYDFGNYANQQPVGVYNYTFPANVQASKIKLVSTGHGGPSNTSNAAEFYDATHHVYINNVNTYTQHNWTTCNPNPDNCMPQSGTWQYNRAGWCPGTIARPFDFTIAQNIITGGNMAVKYVFYEGYIDQCNPNYPGCVSGTTCTDCNADVQPFLVVNSNLINFFNVPPPDPQIVTIEEPKADLGIFIYPNPSNGKFNLMTKDKKQKNNQVAIYNLMGKQIKQFEWNGDDTTIDISNNPSGIYLMKISNSKGADIKKLIVR